MASHIDISEDIESFLERLKLSDKYTVCFQINGYYTVEDCAGLDETRLKEMGVTLPGHYRRILNKLPGCSVSKPPRSPKMSTLSPQTDLEHSGRASPGLQFLPSTTNKTAEARIEHKSIGRMYSLPSPEIAEDPYLTVNSNLFIASAVTTEVPPRPLTPPPFQSSSSQEDETIYESALFTYPVSHEINSEPVDVPFPLESFASFGEDIYLLPSPPKQQDEDPYLSYIRSDPSDEYKLLNEDSANGNEVTTQVEEDAYNHLGDKGSDASHPICNTIATIFPFDSDSLQNGSIHELEIEGEYDILNSDGLSSPRKEKPASPSWPNRLSPRDSNSPSVSHQLSNGNSETEEQYDSLKLNYTAECEKSAKNMPLPLPPWQTAAQDKITHKNLAGESEGRKLPLSKQNSSSSVVIETDFWASDKKANNDESEYDTLSLNYEKANFGSQSSALPIEDEGEDFYEEVDYLKNDVGRQKFDKNEQLPQVPHNTPSHCLDETNKDEDVGSYEEVSFLPIEQRNFKKTLDTVLRDDFDNDARERSMTTSSKMPMKEHKKGRRFTGVHALQKAAHSAKAVVSKRKPKRHGLQDFKESSLSDNESEESQSSSRTSSFGALNKSLEDLTTGSHLPPSHPKSHQRQPSDDLPGNSPMIKPHRLSRISPVARRKRMDALSQNDALDLASDEAGIYEELDPRRGAIDGVSSTDISKLSRSRENVLRPTKPARQRPVSVFMLQRPSQDNFNLEDRSRTYSATLKRDSPAPKDPDPVYAGDNEFMDINEFLKRGPQVISVSPLTKKKTKSGWLLKQGGHEGRAPLRKRWAMFDGDELAYYESDTKTEFAKGILPVEVMNRLLVPSGSQTIFHLQMKGGRTFIFHAENSDDRAMWSSTLMAAILTFQQKCGHQLKPGGNMFMPYKEGLLKMEGVRQKIYMAIKGDQAVYYKSKNEFIFAQPIARLQMKLATVKDIGNRKFQVVFPYRIFTFTADSEEEKKLWIEPLLDAIAEGLSDYQVLNEIWANESNKKCADCGRAFPDWASINLAIVICKHCAGVHRELGVHNSKVRSLKMDIKIWDSKMKRLLIDIGNEEANNFWIYKLSSSDGITDMADKNQRSWFINSKYIDMNYTRDRKEEGHQDLLNQSLIDAVRTDNLIEAYHVTFSGADINCNTGKEHAKTPQLLAEHLTYSTLAEFLRQNGGTDTISPMGHITDRNTSIRKKNSIPKTRSRPPVCLKDFLFKYGGDFKNASEDTKTKGKFNLIISALQPGDFQKRLCVLENNVLKYCDPEKPSIVKDFVSCNDLISITVHTPEQAIKAGYKHCFEVSRTSGRTYLFCAEREETRIKWTRGLLQAIVPPHIQDSMQTEDEYERIGKIRIRAKRWSKADTQWSNTWCCLRKKKLQYFHNESRTMETIDLRRLVQITVDQTREVSSNHTNNLQHLQNKESIPVIMLVFRDKSYYIQSDTRPDSESWMSAIRRADNVSGPTLEEKQLTTEGVPVVLEKCVTYVEQFGIAMRGIYRLSGTHSKTTQLLSDFRQNARETQMREGQMNVHDVANALKRWFKSLPGSLLTEPLHEQWIETAQIRAEHHDTKLEWYKHLLEKLPDINRVTLKMLLVHLRNVASHEKENEMSLHNLAIVFGPTLLEPQDGDGASDKYLGQTSQEIACIEDLLQFYDWLFDVTETDREKERRMQAAKEKINQATMQQNMLTTMDYDMMVPIYINRREDRCVNYKVNLNAGQLISKVCQTHGYPADLWGLYEVIMDGDVERPLHYSEHVLSVIKSWDMPSTNYLLAKNDYIRGKMTWFKQSILGTMGTMMEGQLRVYDGKKKWPKVSGCVYKDVTSNTVYFKYFKTTADSMTLDIRDMATAHKRKRSIKARGKLMGWSKLGSSASDPLAKTPVSMAVSTFNVYVGFDKKTKPPPQTSAKQGFTIIQPGEALKCFVAETEGELYRWISHMLLSMHPEGFTPPVTQESSPSKTAEESNQTKSSKGRSPFGSLSQQDLGAQVAAKVANLKRNPSNESTGSVRDSYLERGRTSSTDSTSLSVSTQGTHTPSRILEDIETVEGEEFRFGSQDDLRPKRTDSAASADFPNRPNQLTTDSHTRRPMLYSPLSPVDPRNQQRAGLGIQLQDELSNVLKKKRPQ